MATNRDPLLNPKNIATHEFATSFRGYDPNEVRRFLQQLAEASRADAAIPAQDPEVINGLVGERDALRRKVSALERAATSAESDDATYVTQTTGIILVKQGFHHTKRQITVQIGNQLIATPDK